MIPLKLAQEAHTATKSSCLYLLLHFRGEKKKFKNLGLYLELELQEAI